MVTVSKNGWTNSDIFFVYLKHFVSLLPPARPVLIIMDSHLSHVSPQSLQFAKENGLIFVTFPSHTTHFLQPLDVAVFAPMKSKWKIGVKMLLRDSGHKPTRKDFFPLFNDVFLETVTMQNILSGFKKTGIFPLTELSALPDDIFKVSETTVSQHEVQVNTEEIEKSTEVVLPPPTPISVRRRKDPAQSARMLGHGASPIKSPTLQPEDVLPSSIPNSVRCSKDPAQRGRKLGDGASPTLQPVPGTSGMRTKLKRKQPSCDSSNIILPVLQ